MAFWNAKQMMQLPRVPLSSETGDHIAPEQKFRCGLDRDCILGMKQVKFESHCITWSIFNFSLIQEIVIIMYVYVVLGAYLASKKLDQ